MAFAEGGNSTTCPHHKAAQQASEASAGPAAKAATDKDKCPVCGMFVAKYPGFLAQIQFRDGSIAFFDGPKDFFKYYFYFVQERMKIFVGQLRQAAKYQRGGQIGGALARDKFPQ